MTGRVPHHQVAAHLLAPALVLLAGLGFAPLFEDWRFVAPLAAGVAVAAAVGAVARRCELLPGEHLALSAAAMALFSGTACAGVPWRLVHDHAVDGWALLVSSPPAATVTPALAVPIYVAAWASTLASVLPANHGALDRRWAIVGPVMLVITVALTAPSTPWTSALAGLTLVTGFFALGPRRPAGAILVAALSGLALVVVPFDSPDRLTLRDPDDRPWEPLEEPSPLVTLKSSLKAGRADEVAFTVTATGDQAPTRFSTAVLGSYDGTVWSVAVGPEQAHRQFEPVDRLVPDEPGRTIQGQPIDLTIESAEVLLWLPTPGWPVEAIADIELRANVETGTLAAPQGVTSYSLRSIPRPELGLDEVAELRVEPRPSTVELTPPSLRDLAGDLFQGVDPGAARAVALAERLRYQGFYDHGDRARPGHSLARLDEFLADPDMISGYAEQYAAAAGVLADIGELPVRVVVGYTIPADRWIDGRAEVRFDDTAAWIEVDTVELGWVPIDVTPNRSREPQPDTAITQIDEVAEPTPPPPSLPPTDPETTVRPETDEGAGDEVGDDRSDAGFIGALVATGSIVVGVPTLVAASTLAVVIGLRGRRRRRRRRRGTSMEQVEGAWRELLDLASATVTDLGERHGTPVEIGRSIDAAGGGRATTIGQLVDRARFGEQPASPGDADRAWAQLHEHERHLRDQLGQINFWSMRADPRPMFRTGRSRRRSVHGSTPAATATPTPMTPTTPTTGTT